jgi:hypothetical protein
MADRDIVIFFFTRQQHQDGEEVVHDIEKFPFHVD